MHRSKKYVYRVNLYQSNNDSLYRVRFICLEFLHLKVILFKPNIPELEKLSQFLPFSTIPISEIQSASIKKKF